MIDNMSDAFEEALNLAEDGTEKAIEYGALIITLRRRIRAAIKLLEQDRLNAARCMLEEALADDGAMLRRRVAKIVHGLREEQQGE